VDFNLAEINEAVAAAIPNRPCLAWRECRRSYAEVAERTRRLASYLSGRGLRAHRERRGLAPWESAQDHVALYMYNCPEYLEGMLGSFKARLVPANVNYRYVDEELVYLLRDSRARAVVYHAAFAPTLGRILPELPDLEVRLQLADESGNDLLPGAVDYEEALAGAAPEMPVTGLSPDDLYVLYTGGTTGHPRGVLWRQADIFAAALGGRRADGSEVEALDEIIARARKGRARVMPTAPLMHAAHWAAFDALHAGNCVVLQDETRRLDPQSILKTVERERVHMFQIIGDAFARPLIDELRANQYDLSALKAVASGGAILTVSVKEQLLELLPEGVNIIDTVGSSETGRQAAQVSSRASGAKTGSFRPHPGACVLDSERTRVLGPVEDEIGWFAQSGRVPLGYLGDRDKTERTFPVVDGVRYSIPGDRARMAAGGEIEVLGRDSVTINTGGEKVFAEEVESALKRHPDVYDAVVCGRPSERWGQEVVAIVQLREGAVADEEGMRDECARHLARYKLPKAYVYRDRIMRSPVGKPDYRWAVAQATGTST
jgi:acyl-CoA synthetase (AMP-forming)/AMP-acid ligase II